MLTVTQRRGGFAEAVHPVSAVLIDAEGHVLERVGAPLVTTWRSAAKPFQLEVSLDLIGQDFDDRSLAVGTSSHAGEPGHIAVVEALLARMGIGEDHLYCGAHWPGTRAAEHALVSAGRRASAVHNNCSGKHSFMAGACATCGWAADYRAPDHPLQQRIRANIDARTAGACREIVTDGCGVPCFVVDLDGMARAWAQLAAATAIRDGNLGRIGHAMGQLPWFASGTHQLDGTVMTASQGRVLGKVGALGLFCVAVPERGLGAAIKVETGSDVARGWAVPWLLAQWFPELIDLAAFERWRVVKNWVGTACGELTAEGIG